MKLATIVGVILLLGSAAYAGDPAAAFQGFCNDWMHKLEVREHDNVSHIRWQTMKDYVLGDYVGYTRDHKCITKTGTASVPVGEITYREIRYEKRGTTIAEAQKSTPRPVETTEVTEIFRYQNGKWIY